MKNSYGVEDILDKFKYLKPLIQKKIDGYSNHYGQKAEKKADYTSLSEHLPELKQSPETLYEQLTAPADVSYLDKLLFGLDDREKTKFLDDLIKKREALKYKVRQEIEREKDGLRPLLFQANYGLLPKENLKDLNKMYGALDQLALAEEVKCWKDTSLIQLKKLDEGLLGGESKDEV